MEKLVHYSHEKHPLILTQLRQQDEGDHQKSNCYGCHKPTLPEPTYTCKECNIFLHKQCAELPRTIAHPGHEEHPMMLLWRSARFNCEACGTDEEQQSYICCTCSFWIHRSCALLPKINYHKGHDHPLSLAYCLPSEYQKYEIPCDICRKEKPVQNWVYYCAPCRYFVHLKCMTTDRFNLVIEGPEPKNSFVQNTSSVILPTNIFIRIISLVMEKQKGKQIKEFGQMEEIHPRFWQYHCGECDQSFHPNCIPTLGESRNIVFGQIVNVSGHEHPIASVPEGDLHASCSSCNVSLYGKRAFKCSTCRYYKCFKCVG
ncbi:hypothetical protein ACH5RR_007344 [Cinchona calisaya]|uniref:DC1 domain-containing protein n=1 Tax=Cinchona calisaya TaxID=153742 RepID=A0ABD3ARV3_9GENT